MAQQSVVYDVPAGRFEQLVLQASHERPVVVDFWAEWCAPCRALGPVLESVVRSYEGRARLAKVDVEQHREEALRYGVQSIPAVKVFSNGNVVAEFMGALPEPEVRRILGAALPSRADALVEEGDRLVRAGRVPEAESQFRKAIEEQPDHTGALLRLGTMEAEAGHADRARELLSRIGEDAAEHSVAQGLLARLDFAENCRRKGGRGACAERAAKDPDDLQARYDLACCLASEGDYEAALEEFLCIVSADRTWNDQAAKTAMVRIFSLVGPRSELADAYRRKLAAALY
jgi:putative thioredoxin